MSGSSPMKMVALQDVAVSIVDGPFGSNLKTSDYVDSGVPVLQGKNITDNRFVWKEIRFVTSQKAATLKRSQAEVGDHLLVKIGSIGYSAVIDDLDGHPFAIIPANLIRLRPDRTRVDDRYLHRVLTSRRLERHFKGIASKTAQPALSLKKVKETQIPLPPLEEQKRIARILDEADALRAKRRESIEQLDTLLQSIFLDMFGDPVTNPKGWEVRELQAVVDPSRPTTYGILKPGPDVEDGVKYIRVVDIKNGRVNDDQLRRTSYEIAQQYRRSKLAEGDLLISIRGHVGRMALVPSECEGANITQDTARLAISDAFPRFIMECLATPGIQACMARRTKGVAVQGINLGDLRRVPVILPPRAKQEEFSRLSATLESLAALLRAHLTELDTLFASLQSRAFSGEL